MQSTRAYPQGEANSSQTSADAAWLPQQTCRKSDLRNTITGDGPFGASPSGTNVTNLATFSAAVTELRALDISATNVANPFPYEEFQEVRVFPLVI